MARELCQLSGNACSPNSKSENAATQQENRRVREEDISSLEVSQKKKKNTHSDFVIDVR
jgi:hypothetical protein